MNSKKMIISVFIGLILVCFMTGNLPAAEVITETQTIPVVMTEETAVKVADNFIIMYDSSGSMMGTYKDTSIVKIDMEKKILEDMIEALPDLGFNAGLYNFTPWQPYYPMARYNKAAFDSAVKKLPTPATTTPYANRYLNQLKVGAGVVKVTPVG